MQNRLQTAKLLKYFQQKLLTENVGSKESLGNERSNTHSRTVFHPPLPLFDKNF